MQPVTPKKKNAAMHPTKVEFAVWYGLSASLPESIALCFTMASPHREYIKELRENEGLNMFLRSIRSSRLRPLETAVLALLTVLGAEACSPNPEGSEAVEASAGSQSLEGADGMVVTRDPETGELRSATAEERRRLGLDTVVRQSERPDLVEQRSDGSYSVVVHPSAMSYSVLSQKNDGTSITRCVSAAEIEKGVAPLSPRKTQSEGWRDR